MADAPRQYFVKGGPGGPGRKPGSGVVPGFNALKNLTKKELADVSNVLIKGDMDGLRTMAKDPKAPALLAVLASIIVKMYDRGDMASLDMLFNRIIGKVRDEVLHGGAIGGNHGSTVIVTLPSNGREVLPPPPTVIPAAPEPTEQDDDLDLGFE